MNTSVESTFEKAVNLALTSSSHLVCITATAIQKLYAFSQKYFFGKGNLIPRFFQLNTSCCQKKYNLFT
jgi:hypothetical protein